MANMLAGLYSVAVCWDFPIAFFLQAERCWYCYLYECEQTSYKEKKRKSVTERKWARGVFRNSMNSGTSYKIIWNTKHHKSSVSAILYPSHIIIPSYTHIQHFFYLFYLYISCFLLVTCTFSVILAFFNEPNKVEAMNFVFVLVFYIHIYTYNLHPTWLSWRLAW